MWFILVAAFWAHPEVWCLTLPTTLALQRAQDSLFAFKEKDHPQTCGFSGEGRRLATHTLAGYLPRLRVSVDGHLSCSPLVLSNDKQQFCKGFNVLYPLPPPKKKTKQNSLRAEREQCLSSRGIWGKTVFSRMLEEATWKQGRLRPEVGTSV